MSREEAYKHGAWACPACPDGWQVYMIGIDMNICAICGYKGGDPKAHTAAIELAKSYTIVADEPPEIIE